jgi:hypothetical protein
LFNNWFQFIGNSLYQNFTYMRTFTTRTQSLCALKASLLFILLSILVVPSYGEGISGFVTKTGKADYKMSLDFINQSNSDLIHRSFTITLDQIFDSSKAVDLIYDLHSPTNIFHKTNFVIQNKVLQDNNLWIDDNFNIKVVQERLVARYSSKIKNTHAKIKRGSTERSFCSLVLVTDYYGSSKTLENRETYRECSYNESLKPCGAVSDENCQAFEITKWHCIDVDLSTPTAYLEYAATDYMGVNISSLTANRTNYITDWLT